MPVSKMSDTELGKTLRAGIAATETFMAESMSPVSRNPGMALAYLAGWMCNDEAVSNALRRLASPDDTKEKSDV